MTDQYPPPSARPEPPEGGPAWADLGDLAQVLPADAVLMGTTPGGLPFPESSEPLTEAANAIKALAIAVENRGGGFVSTRGRVRLTFAGGRPTVPPPLPAGMFGAIGGVLLSCEWGDGPAVPLSMAVETSLQGVTNLALLGYLPPVPGANPPESNWFGGPVWVSYLVWGTAP